MPPFAFFLGHGRSGTTLVQAIFDSHPALAVAHEARFVTQLARRRRRYEQAGGFDAETFVTDLFATRDIRNLGLDPQTVRTSLSDPPPPSYAEAVRRVFAAFAARSGKSRYGDKTPSYVRHIPLLAELFPEGRFIHIIRDGRDAALSNLERHRGPTSLAGNAYDWRNDVVAGTRSGRTLGPSRYWELRYEDLVADPEAAVRPVCDLLELDYDPAMLRYHERAEEIVGTVVNPYRFEHVYRPPTKGLRDWRTAMAPDEVALYEAIAGETLAHLGYERISPRGAASRPVMARAWLGWQQERVAFQSRAARRRLRSRLRA